MGFDDERAPAVAWTGERYLPAIPGDIRLEHLHRYYVARELARGKRVLDIACGEGYGADLLASVAAHVVGVDSAADVIDHAARRYKRQNLEFRGGSCAAIPLTDKSIDLVVSFETIEHHDQHERMLAEIARVLAPDGLVLISSPDRREYSERSGYRNPFHVRELDRAEFETLLRSSFSNVTLMGQRIRAGSLIAPVEGRAVADFVSYREDEVGFHRLAGLESPVYLLALAGNAPLPSLPIGLMDGGVFAWPPAHEAPSPAREQSQTPAPAVAAPAPEAAAKAADLTRANALLRQKLSDLEGLVVRVRRLTDQHREQALTAQAESLTVKAQLVDVSRELAGARLRVQEAERRALEHVETGNRLRTHLGSVEADRRAMRDGLEQAAQDRARFAADRDRWHAREAELTGAVADADADAAALRGSIAVIYRSRSWRVTQPLRDARTLAGRAKRRTWYLAARAARLAYRALPMPLRLKMAIKHAVFSQLGGRFAHTAAYRAWQASFAALAPDPAGSSSALASDEVFVTSHEPSTVANDVAPPDPAGPEQPAVVETVAEVATAVPTWLSRDASPDYVALSRAVPLQSAIKTIAFYLPQFHPIPENDAWWGRGFTEWTNVVHGQPQYDGHYQPHLPGELGFYDLRVKAVQQRQIELARLHGIHGFCYYHYWFSGTPLLRGPLEQLLSDRELDFPFCLCWANENWTRRWDGRDDDVLIAQQHHATDDETFIRDIEPALRDPRYIRVNGRPVLLVYRPALLPNVATTAARWRQYCRAAGIGDLFLVSTYAFDRIDPREFGFDAALEFVPNNIDVPLVTDLPGVLPAFGGTVRDYRAFVERSRTHGPAGRFPLFRSVTPMWDNEARRPGRGTSYAHSTPERYREWLSNVCHYTARHLPPEMPFVFINAWNEWSEGAHLEPDRRHGYAYLQATADALAEFPAQPQATFRVVVVSHDAHLNGAQMLALHLVRSLAGTFHAHVDVLLCGEGVLGPEFAAAAARVQPFGSTVTEEQRRAIARRLYRQGARIAICNTSVVGDAVELLKSEGFSVISLIHELPGLIRSMHLEGSIAKIAGHADRVVFPAEVVRAAFRTLTGVDVVRTEVRPQGLFAPNPFAGPRQAEARRALRERLGLPPEARIVLGVGMADRRKGIDLFVDVGRALLAEHDDLVFVWLGAPDPEVFREAAQTIEPHLRSRFCFPPPVPDFEVFFAGADLYLMTSREDPFPNVVLHALDAGLPVIGFDGAGGFVDVLRRGYGVLVPYLDTTAMARAVAKLLASPPERARLSAAGVDLIGQEFSFTAYVRDLLGFVQPSRARRVSVVVPNCNYARYIPERLRSITGQTLLPHEVIFLDDASTDESVEVARAHLHASGLPYRIIRNETRQGTYRQWLRGFREVTGDLVWIAEADDVCDLRFLETMAAAFDRDDVVLAYCQSRQIDANGGEIQPDYLDYTFEVSPTKWLEPYVRPGVDEIRDTLFVKNTIPNVSAVLFRRPDLSSIEADLPRLKFAGDWLTYVTVLNQGRIAFVPESLNSHRRHQDSAIAKGGMELMKEIVAIQRHIFDRHPITPAVLMQREQACQGVYEYLGLNRSGPRGFGDHPELGALETAGA